MDNPESFIRANTAAAPPALVPELRLHLATEITPLWQATEAALNAINLPPPYWAFPWAGGQALARQILDQPALVAGRRVLDFAAGSGIVALAAARAGAAHVQAVEIDAVAAAAIALNAGLNGLAVQVVCEDLVGRPLPDVDVVLAGDVCYERPMAERVFAWLRALSGAGKTVLMGDPGRNYLPTSGLEAVARHLVPTSRELEDREQRDTTIWRVLPA
jgi:predicted nicotinamide N-methyase